VLTVIVEPPVTVVIGNKTATPICSGETFTVTPATGGGDIVPAGVSYTWTVANNTSITGESAVTTLQTSISQQLTNTTSLTSTVIYTVTPRYGTDGSCSGPTFQVSVQVNPRASITTQPLGASACQNGTTPALTVAHTGGTGTPTYQWFSNTTNSNTGGIAIANATAATFAPPTNSLGIQYYYAQLTFSGGGACSTVLSNPAKIEIVGSATITTQPDALKTICVGGTTTHTLTVAGGTGTAAYQWYLTPTNSNSGGTAVAGATSASFTPPVFTTAGDYYYYAVITLTGSICGTTLNSDVAQVKVIADPIITSQPVTSQILCQNVTPTNLTVTISGGSGTPTYQWFSNTTNSNTGGTAIAGKTAATFTPPTTAVGTLYYYVQLSFATGGCTSVTSNPAKIEVVAVTLTEVVASRKNILCYGDATGNISVQGSGGVKKYTYTITGKDYTGSTISLSSGPIDLDVFSFATLKAGDYVLTLTDQTGCQKSTTPITLTQPLAPLQITNDISKSITCFGKKDGSITFSILGGTAPFKIQWAHGPQGATLNNLEKGVYSVVITDAGGCKVDKQFVINEPQALDLSTTVTDALDCEVQNSGAISINPFGGTPPYTYNWSNGSKTQNLSAIGPGSYSLELVDANGCRVLRQFTIIRPAALEASVVQTTVRVCEPRALKSNFKVNVKGGIPPYTVTWNRGTATNAGLIMDTQELGEFIVTVKDARGCIVTKRMEVIEVDPPVPGFDFKS
jgi:hypothetical protein